MCVYMCASVHVKMSDFPWSDRGQKSVVILANSKKKFFHPKFDGTNHHQHFYTVPMELNGVMLASSMWVCVFIRLCMSRTKCTIMYREQRAGPRSAHFCVHINVDKIHSRANFYPNRQRYWPSFSRSKIRIEYIVTFIREYLSNGDRVNIAIANAEEVTCGLSIGIFTFDRGQI